eukprot:gene16200-biopygen297
MQIETGADTGADAGRLIDVDHTVHSAPDARAELHACIVVHTLCVLWRGDSSLQTAAPPVAAGSRGGKAVVEEFSRHNVDPNSWKESWRGRAHVSAVCRKQRHCPQQCASGTVIQCHA